MISVPQPSPVSPPHAILLGFPVALFVSAMVADIAYMRTSEIQWTNFSAWLNAGGLLFGLAVIGFALVDLLRAPARRGRVLYLALLALMWGLGLMNAFIHGRDAWYSVTGTGLFLSVVTALLAFAAAWIRFQGFDRGEAR